MGWFSVFTWKEIIILCNVRILQSVDRQYCAQLIVAKVIVIMWVSYCSSIILTLRWDIMKNCIRLLWYFTMKVCSLFTWNNPAPTIKFKIRYIKWRMSDMEDSILLCSDVTSRLAGTLASSSAWTLACTSGFSIIYKNSRVSVAAPVSAPQPNNASVER